MTRDDFDEDELLDLIKKMHTPKHRYDRVAELLDAGDFVADYGSFGDQFEGEDLVRARIWNGDPAAAWGMLAHWSIERGDPEYAPIPAFEQHFTICPTCMYLEEVRDLWDRFKYEFCDDCGLDLNQHDVAPDPIGKAHAWCRDVWTRAEPAVGPAGDHAENQISDAFDARWWARLSDGNHALVSRTYYVCRELDESGDIDPEGLEYMVEETEYLVCTDPADPGTSELNADYVYTDLGHAHDMNPETMARDAVQPEPGEWQTNAPDPFKELLIASTPVAAA